MRVWNVAAIISMLVIGPHVSAFYSTSMGQGHRKASQLFSDPPQLLTEYMVKAHEDKLRAIKELEEKKNAEIEMLKQKLKALKSAPGALTTTTASPAPLPAGLDINAMTKEQLAQKLFAYQQFMAKYIVDAQVQKTKAVLAAENAIKQKYDEKLRLLSSTSSATTTEITPSTTTTTTSVAFQERSAKVSAAAAAGKSRWGDLENQKASQVAGAVKSTSTPVNGAVAPSTLTLPSPSVATTAPGSIRAFDERNAMVAAAGQAGKSRWGDLEVAKATQAAGVALPASSTPAATASSPASVPTIDIQVPPEVEAADHGLRADGGVGGPSLAERVNFGAQLLQGSVPAPLANTRAPSTASSTSIYYTKRNAMVLAAAKAGKSRWGEMEVQRVQSLVGALPASPGSPLDSPVQVTPEIEAADHGLRADGGVGGPSLAQRVNFGAALLGQ